MSTLVFDIEVAGLSWEEIDEITRGYLLARERDPERREAVPERTALYPGLGKVIAVALWSVEEDRGLLLLEGERESEAESRGADCVAVSNLLTTTMVGQRDVAEELERRSLRGAVKLLVGGAPVTEEWAHEIGADGYAGDAVAAVDLVERVIAGDA